MSHVARRLFEGASPRLVALVGVLTSAVLAAQGALVYVAVDQVDRSSDIAEFVRRLSPADLGSRSGPPLRLDARPTPIVTVPAAGVDTDVRLADQAEVPGQVQLILASGPLLPPAGPPPPTPDVGGSTPPVRTPAGEPAPIAEPVPSGDEAADQEPAQTRRLANPDDDDREDLASSPSDQTTSDDERAGDDPGRGSPDGRPGNRCDDERVDHHDDGDDHGVDCGEPEGGDSGEAPPTARDRDDHANRNLTGDGDRRDGRVAGSKGPRPDGGDDRPARTEAESDDRGPAERDGGDRDRDGDPEDGNDREDREDREGRGGGDGDARRGGNAQERSG